MAVPAMSYADACRVLHVREGAPLYVAEAAYRVVAKANHPDAGGSTKHMSRVNEAIEVIRLVGARITREPACIVRPGACDIELRAGKFSGLRLEEVPMSYLGWMAENWSGTDMRQAAVEVLHWLSR